MDPNEVAYYANQPLWFVLATDLAIVITNAYEVAAGTSLALVDQGWRNLTIVVGAIALLQFAYAWSVKRRGILK